ncbi:MAG: response regulator [bacterium]|nr:response regulator [bacterium]
MKKKYKVHLVDDDKFLLEMYKRKFEKYELETDISVGPLDVLPKLRAGLTPDILVLDIIMPDMDGIELLQTIRNEKLVPSAIIIMLTNESDQERIDKAKALGAAGYIIKATSIPSEVVEEVLKIADSKTE